jgi:hypothetical protein
LQLGKEGKEAVMKKWGLKQEKPVPKYTRTTGKQVNNLPVATEASVVT